jgi:hypothetical protein
MRALYVIESRDAEGKLSFTAPQPESVFGLKAIHGITDDEMAQAIWRKEPDAVLDGRFLCDWPAIIDPRWKARRKTW